MNLAALFMQLRNACVEIFRNFYYFILLGSLFPNQLRRNSITIIQLEQVVISYFFLDDRCNNGMCFLTRCFIFIFFNIKNSCDVIQMFAQLWKNGFGELCVKFCELGHVDIPVIFLNEVGSATINDAQIVAASNIAWQCSIVQRE